MKRFLLILLTLFCLCAFASFALSETIPTPTRSGTPMPSFILLPGLPGGEATPAASGTPVSSQSPGLEATPAASGTPVSSQSPGLEATPAASGTPVSSQSPGLEATPPASDRPAATEAAEEGEESFSSEPPAGETTPAGESTPAVEATPSTEATPQTEPSVSPSAGVPTPEETPGTSPSSTVEQATLPPTELPDAIEATAGISIPENAKVRSQVGYERQGEVLVYGDTVVLTALLTGFDDVDYTLQWFQSADQVNWTAVPDATRPVYRFPITEENAGYAWRVQVTIR